MWGILALATGCVADADSGDGAGGGTGDQAVDCRDRPAASACPQGLTCQPGAGEVWRCAASPGERLDGGERVLHCPDGSEAVCVVDDAGLGTCICPIASDASSGSGGWEGRDGSVGGSLPADWGLGGGGGGGWEADGTPTGGAGGGGAGEGGAGGGEPHAPTDPVVTLSWDAEGAHLRVVDGAENGPYLFGLAETGLGQAGWYGEDCIEGLSGGVDVCHSVPESGMLDLVHVGSVDEVTDGQTLLSEDSALGLTYVLIRDTEESLGCWTWGHDPAFYADPPLGCSIVEPR